jgi:hypothetical protein
MSTPSLLCVPYRLKAGTLYSQIPDSGLGDFVVTRSASNSATRVNSRGLIETVLDNVPRLDYPLGGITAGCPALLVEPSAQNIALNSAVISGTPTGTSIDANVGVSPDGATTADKLKEDSNPGNHNLAGIIGGALGGTVDSSAYRISIFAKADGRTQFTFFDNNQSGAGAGTSTFNLSNGTATGTGLIQNYGNGWYRCIISCAKTASTSANALVGLLDAGGNQSYTGNGTSGILFWGKQLETGSIATSYIPTAASPVTRGAETISKTGVSSLIGQTEGTIYAEVVLSNNSAGSIFLLDNGSTSTFLNIVRNTAQNIQVTLRNGGGTIATIITSSALANGVHKIALSYTNGAYSLYINGSPAGTSTNSTDYPASLTRASISTSDYGAPYFPRNDRIRAHALYPTRLPNTGPLSLQSLTQ